MDAPAHPHPQPRAQAQPRRSCPTLPNELILKIMHLAIDQPAVYFFDVSIASAVLPHPPLTTAGCRVRFHPIHSPTPGFALTIVNTGHTIASPPTSRRQRGTFEPQASKHIRALMGVCRMFRFELMHCLQAIPVPTATNPFNKVWFNPSIHIIGIHRVSLLYLRSSIHPLDSWVKQDSELWAELNFDIQHLGFLWDCASAYRAVAVFSFVFPTLRKLYSLVIHQPRPDHRKSLPLEPVFQDRQAQLFRPTYLHMAKRCWDLSKKDYLLYVKSGKPCEAALCKNEFKTHEKEPVILR